MGASRIVAKILNNYVSCRKLRGKFVTQHMADLPSERTEAPPPFTNVGFDVFGPWTIHTKRTREGTVNSERWGLVFTCLNSRAIHIELLEAMDSSSFICALRPFLSIRGPVSGATVAQTSSEGSVAKRRIKRSTVKESREMGYRAKLRMAT